MHFSSWVSNPYIHIYMPVIIVFCSFVDKYDIGQQASDNIIDKVTELALDFGEVRRL